MADIVPATTGPAISFPGGGSVLTRVSGFTAQPAVRKMLPAFVGLAAIGGALLAWSMLSPSPQRTLYSQLDDSERASVAAALEQAGITYIIDNQSGALTVPEGDYYKARMLVASDGALAAPESGDAMLDKLPMGASRTLEGERLRSAREHDLQLSIMEIDGVEAVRVHLAQGERSVFVRDNTPPSASVMVRLARGRTLSDGQVRAIVNLVAGSVPGLTAEAVRVVDQHGDLLSDPDAGKDSVFDLQSRMEAKLRDQVDQLLTPMLGQGNFSSEIQVQLDMNEITSARESYDKDGVVRSETQQQSQSSAPGQTGGVPGVLSNTPPPATQVQAAPPQGTAPPAPGATPPSNGESSSTRNYELGRQVEVTNNHPGDLKRISVAVAVSREAMKNGKATDVTDLQQLISAAVGADTQRGDQVKVIMRTFQPDETVAPAFYETPWFAIVVRNVAALLAVLLVLLLGVRPALKALRGDGSSKKQAKGSNPADIAAAALSAPQAVPVRSTEGVQVDVSRADLLSAQVNLAQRLVSEKPEQAVQALRQMLKDPADAGAAGAR
ncbi:flagellar basal-body MS-ring/collar protein FliF [Novosphingobium sp. 9]|uniref:flagellar basal-body MS-ring/collar protein FliF n=1 Tax=Novosphingobium sp. 9 TaxID=2025349 RepID=UPI0021B63D4A|nr:flagellar basal-body MS-ring/collar protein FliF [Novosphingobium sp. 9]